MADNEGRLSTRDIAGAAAEDKRRGGSAAVEDPEAVRASDAESEAVAPLFASDETQGYRTRWDGIQTGFVDEPRRAVEEADALVADLMKRLAEGFARERDALEKQWDRGDQISTEDLRVALRRYRSFFQRLLSL